MKNESILKKIYNDEKREISTKNGGGNPCLGLAPEPLESRLSVISNEFFKDIFLLARHLLDEWLGAYEQVRDQSESSE